jgi:hypothetical protein
MGGVLKVSLRRPEAYLRARSRNLLFCCNANFSGLEIKIKRWASLTPNRT